MSQDDRPSGGRPRASVRLTEDGDAGNGDDGVTRTAAAAAASRTLLGGASYAARSSSMGSGVTAAFMSSTSRGDVRRELEQKIRDAFHEAQRQKHRRPAQLLALGQGLGAPAEATIDEGHYNPPQVLLPLSEEDKKLWGPALMTGTYQTSCAGVRKGSAGDGDGDAAPAEAGSPDKLLTMVDHDPSFPFLERVQCSEGAVSAVLEVQAAVEENIRLAEEELQSLCTPFTFVEVLETIATALQVLERGDLDERVTLPMYTCQGWQSDEGATHGLGSLETARPARSQACATPDATTRASTGPCLTGAVEVLRFVQRHVLKVAYELLPTTHAVQWVLQYTVTFLRAVEAGSVREAEVRVELLARCIRLLAATENFSAVLLSLESRVEEYQAFDELRVSAEMHVYRLLDDIEASLNAVLSCPFPTRRARLQLVEKGVRKKLQRALLFLTEIDYNWTPTVHFHLRWKDQFLGCAFERIHARIAPRFLSCTLGFIDEALYGPVKTMRAAGRYTSSLLTQPTVPRACRVEHERVTERLNFAQIGVDVKGVPSLIVGHQLCMGARYVLRQCTAAYDEAWGFVMDEPIAEAKPEAVARVVSRLAARLKEKTRPAGRQPPSTTFLTEAPAEADATAE